MAGGVEFLLGGLHPDICKLETEGDEAVVGRIVDDDDVAGAGDASRCGDVRSHLLHRHVEQGLIAHGRHVQVPHQWERPAGVVVRRGIRRREVLEGEIHVRDRAIWLVAADDVITRFDLHLARAERARRDVELEALAAQVIDSFGGVFFGVLRRRNHPAEDRAGRPPRDRALVLEPIVLEVRLLVLRDVVEGKENRRLLDVGVVAGAPLDVRQRRIGPEPLAARRRDRWTHLVVVRTVALHLIEAADGVVRVGDEEQVVRHPAVVEAVCPHAGDAAAAARFVISSTSFLASIHHSSMVIGSICSLYGPVPVDA